jgi:hypothetical protein
MPLQIRRGTDAQRQAMTQALAPGELLYVTDTQRIYVGTGSALGGIAVTGYTNEDAQDAAAALFSSGSHTGITFTYNDASASISAAVDLLNNEGTIGGVFKGNVVAEDSTLLIDAASGRIVGPVFANVTGNLTGNVTGNVAGVITGTAGSTITGNLTGNVTGNVTGNLTGNVTGTLTGTVRLSDSTAVVDDEGNVNANEFSGSTVRLFGRNNSNIPACIRIDTDSEFFDNFDLFTTSTAHTGTGGGIHRHLRSRGTILAPTALVNGDSISTIVFAGADGSVNVFKGTHFINVTVDNTVTSGNVPTRMILGFFNASNTAEATLTFGTDHVLNLNTVTNIAAGGASGQVNLGGGVLGYLKVQVGATAFGIPMYGINP